MSGRKQVNLAAKIDEPQSSMRRSRRAVTSGNPSSLTDTKAAQPEGDESFFEELVEFACPHCSKQYKRETALKAHVKSRICQSQEQAKPAVARRKSVAASSNELSDDNAATQEPVSSSDDTTPHKRQAANRQLPGESSRPSKRARQSRISYREEDDSSTDSSIQEEADDSSSSPSTVESSKTSGRKTRTKPSVAIPEDLNCPHCQKHFKLSSGLSYHLEKYVCRQELRPGGPVKKGKRKSDATDASKVYKRIRGKLDDRTCPKCKRVFTSTLGLNYHVEKKVCEVKAKHAGDKQDGIGPFPTIEPGTLFATKFGVVQVVNDNRAHPTARYADDYKLQAKKFGNAKSQFDSKMQKFRLGNTVDHLSKRAKLTELYQDGAITQQSVFATRLGVNHPIAFKSRSYPPLVVAPTLRPDPSEPPESYPERIVECVVLADKRRRYSKDDEEALMDVKPSGLVGCTMFLQRRLLMTPYHEHVSLFCCDKCGQEFASKTGIKYHLQSEVCVAKKKQFKELYLKRTNALVHVKPEPFVAQLVADGQVQQTDLASFSTPSDIAHSEKRIFKRKKEKSVVNVSVYPQVYLALGFKLLPRSNLSVKKSTISAFPKQQTKKDDARTANDDMEIDQVVSNSSGAASELLPESNPPQLQKIEFDDPRDVLADLERQLKIEESKTLGPVYTSVFRSLGFQKPKPKSKGKKKRSAKATQRELKKDSGTLPVPIQSSKVALPPTYSDEAPIAKDASKHVAGSAATAPHNHQVHVIDTKVLATEVVAGRYPSKNRNGADVVHKKDCYLCNDVSNAPLLPCQFCANSVHFECMLSRYIVKKPELDGDDFMCSMCINYIHHRRMRAEKRRLDKLAKSTTANDAAAAELLLQTAAKEAKNGLLDQGQGIAEIAELFNDGRSRLAQCLESAKLDQLRYAAIESCEKEAQLVAMMWDD